MKSRKIHQTRDNLVSGKDTQSKPETKFTLESQLVTSLGFTHHYLSLASSEYETLLNSDKLDIAILAHEIALLEAKRNLLQTKLDHLVSVSRIKLQRQQEKEWRETLARQRAEKLEKEVSKEHERKVKALRGSERLLYKTTGELPAERTQRLQQAFEEFLKELK